MRIKGENLDPLLGEGCDKLLPYIGHLGSPHTIKAKKSLFLLRIHELDPYRGIWLFSNVSLLLKALLAATLIALAEELIFRGAFFSGLYKKTGAFIAVTFTSLVYAAVHFVRYPDLITDSSIGWLTGIQMMPDAFRRFHEWAIADYFLTLFIFGVLLSLLRLKHKNIAACIGMHAGVVMLIKIADYFTNRGSNSDFDYLVSLIYLVELLCLY